MGFFGKGKKKIGKRIRRAIMAVLAPLLGIILIVVVIIAAIQNIFSALASTLDAISDFVTNTYVSIMAMVDDDVACQLFRIQNADSIYDLSAADVAKAIRWAQDNDELDSLAGGLYSTSDILYILDAVAENELDTSLTGLYYNSSYRRTFQVEELVEIYLQAYTTLCIEGKLPGGYECFSELSESGSVSVSVSQNYDWVVEDEDSELYLALKELDDIVAEFTGDDDIVKRSTNSVSLLAPSDSLSGVSAYEMIAYPYVYEVNEGYYEENIEQAVEYMYLFVLRMQEWFNGNSEHEAYGDLVNCDPVYEYVLREAGVDFVNTDATDFNEDVSDYYGLANYRTSGLSTGHVFYDIYKSLDDGVEYGLWYARALKFQDLYYGKTTFRLFSVTNNIDASGLLGDISFLSDAVLQQSGSALSFTLSFHPYNDALTSYSALNAFKKPASITEGEVAEAFSAVSYEEQAALGADLGYYQFVDVDLSQNYVNLSYYDVEKELGVTWNLVLGLCVVNDLTSGNYDGEKLTLDKDFVDDCVDAVIKGDITCYSENSIEEIADQLTGLGLSSLSDRESTYLTKNQASALTHTSSAADLVYIGKGYYTEDKCTPAYAVESYSSILIDVETTMVSDDAVKVSSVSTHVSRLNTALKNLGISDGIDNSLLRMLSASFPGLSDELDRIDAMNEEDYVIEEGPLAEDNIVYLSDFTELSEAAEEGSDSDESQNADSNSVDGFDIYTWFYADSEGSEGSVVTTWFTEDDSSKNLMQIRASGQIYNITTDNGIKVTHNLRYRTLTDAEIDTILETAGLSESTDEQSDPTMYTVILTALKAVGNIEYQNNVRQFYKNAYSSGGTNNWSNNVDYMNNWFRSYGYFYGSEFWPTGVNTLAYSADCSSFIAWLYTTAGKNIIGWNDSTGSYRDSAPATSTYILAASSGVDVGYIGSDTYGKAVYKGTDLNLSQLQVGDIIIMKNSSTSHAMLYIGQIDSEFYAVVECNGLMYYEDSKLSSQTQYRGNVLYNIRKYDTSTYDYYIFRVPENYLAR